MAAARKSTKGKAPRQATAKRSAKRANKARPATSAKKIRAKSRTTSRIKEAAPSTALKRKSNLKNVKDKLTKNQILKQIAESSNDLNQKQVALVFESLHELVQGALSKGGCGEFAIPNIGVKIRRVKKKATKARWGRNPATGEQVWIEAKPARQVIKVTALKALKSTID